MLYLVATFKATIDSDFVNSKDKKQVTETINHLARRLLTVVVVVGKRMSIVADLYNSNLCYKGVRCR